MKLIPLTTLLLFLAPALPALDEFTGPGMLHGDINIGGMSISGADLNNDYKSSTYKPDFGDALSIMVGMQGGYLSPYGFYTDLGFDVGPLRTITSDTAGVVLFGGVGIPYTQEEKLDFTQYRFTVIPGFMLPLSRKLLFSAQVGLGYSFINGVFTDTTTIGGSSSESGYTLQGGGFDYVPELRLHYLLKPRLAVGLAVGWNGSKFTTINGCCGTGGYEGATFNNPVKNNSGSNYTIDHTGVYGKLVITTFLKDLIPGGNAPAAAASTEAPANDAPTQAPAQTPQAITTDGAASAAPGSAAPGPDAQAELKAGKEAMAAGDYAGAEAHFLAVTQADPNNAKAWQLLGNSRVYLKRKADALDAYDKSLSLDPNNPSLQDYVKKLKQ